jgi:hypothetical protein
MKVSDVSGASADLWAIKDKIKQTKYTLIQNSN